MNFRTFRNLIKKNFINMTKNKVLLSTKINKEEIWNIYLASFPEGSNPLYKERTAHDCNACRNFITHYGNIVSVDANGKLYTLWDGDFEEPYVNVAQEIRKYVKSCEIDTVFFSSEKDAGILENHKADENGKVTTYSHFHLEIPDEYIITSASGLNKTKSRCRDNFRVLYRSITEITDDAIETVEDLIRQKILYRGDQYLYQINLLRSTKEHSKNFTAKQLINYVWYVSQTKSDICKVKNTAIGTLLVNLSEGKDLDDSVKQYESIVAPYNYKRPKAIFTKRVLEEAKKKIKELGYENSLLRRFATVEDISVNNVLYVDRNTKKRIVGNAVEDVFDDLEKHVKTNKKKLQIVKNISIEDFIEKVIPTAEKIEVILSEKHQGNFVTLLAPEYSDAPSIFKWNNGFSWTYTGNMTDGIDKHVKKLGGNINGDLRFSIMWNENNDNNNDFDAHCWYNGKKKIWYDNKKSHDLNGYLDVDVVIPKSDTPDGIACENIVFGDTNSMPDGVYLFRVHNYTHRGGTSGFKAQVVIGDEKYSYQYSENIPVKKYIDVAEITRKNNSFKIKHLLKPIEPNITKWNVSTNVFTRVQMITRSPNYWDTNKVGSQHYFFFLENCKCDENIRGFFNEYLKDDLVVHKRVFEALGNRLTIKPSKNQLSGLGFIATKQNEIICKVYGSSIRMFNIQF